MTDLTKRMPVPLRGVNLGGWLVLEKWMTPAVFRDTAAADEYGLCTQLDSKKAARLKEHRDSFITEADFVWLASHGIEAVRLPIGYWLFGNAEPYVSCAEYVDKAFQWASRHNIRILLDVHGAPGSQNGKDHSGKIGAIGWPDKIPETIDFIDALMGRYGANPQLLGVELLNEPSVRLPKRYMKRYYQAAYEIITKKAKHDPRSDLWVVFNPYSMAWRWRRELRHQSVVADVHSYQCFSKHDKKLTLPGHIRKLFGASRRGLLRIGRGHPILIGEWSLTLSEQSTAGYSDYEKKLVSQAYGAAQLVAYRDAKAWFYWSYKTQHGGSWSFRDCVEKGYLPDFSKL